MNRMSAFARRARRPVLVAATLLMAAGASFAADLGDVEIHGFLSQGFLKSNENNYLARSSKGSFDFNEMGINFSTSPAPKLRIGVQLFSRALGDLGEHKVDLDWAFADYRFDDRFGVRVGRIKTPYGFYNQIADIDSLRTTVLLPFGVYDIRFRDMMVALTGAEAYGTLKLGPVGSLDYEVYRGNTQLGTDSSVSKVFNDAGVFVVRKWNVDRIEGGELIWNAPLSGLRFAATLARSSFTMDGDTTPQAAALLHLPPTLQMSSNNQQFVVYSGEYVTDKFSLRAEQSRWRARWDSDVLPTRFLDRRSWYGQGTYRFSRLVEASAMRSVFEDKESGNDQKEWVGSLRFDINDNWIAKVEYHDIRGTAGLLDADNGTATFIPQLQPVLADKWRLLAVKLSFIF